MLLFLPSPPITRMVFRPSTALDVDACVLPLVESISSPTAIQMGKRAKESHIACLIPQDWHCGAQTPIHDTNRAFTGSFTCEGTIGITQEALVTMNMALLLQLDLHHAFGGCRIARSRRKRQRTLYIWYVLNKSIRKSSAVTDSTILVKLSSA